ncbi:DUF2938 domain-containing protein [Rheinheimera muenzenbergensis]|uniref:DUF2938 domain-containing protein n=1 Tax=Rheinheimera muenzenbergensis TaxID=1193628 RepID=A0ABU8C198_9GAMM
MNQLLSIVIIGIGATALMDVWTVLRKALFGVAPANYGMVGRWLLHMTKGQFRHDAIATAPAMPFEHSVGWIAHYLIGIAFAGLLIAVCGETWLHNPALLPALAVGIVTVAAPFLLMQPGMGAGIAASRTPHPPTARLHSLITHAVFGLGLYASGWLVKLLSIL